MIKGKTVGMIVACDLTGMIGYDGTIPWKCPADMKRFKELTMGHTLIMGSKTFDSLPRKPLPGRTTHVLHHPTSLIPDIHFEGVKRFTSILKAVEEAPTDLVWIAGGAQIYAEALMLNMPDFIDLSIIDGVCLPAVKDRIPESLEKTIVLPPIPYFYRVESETVNPDDPKLWHRKYVIREKWGWNEPQI